MPIVELISPLSTFDRSPVPVGTSLSTVHARYGSHLPCVLVLNGAPVMRAEWHRTVADGDELSVLIIPGKGGFKQILGAVALIALAVVAPGIGTAIAGAGIGGTLVSAGIVLAGSLLINALLTPKTKKTAADSNTLGQSPTYSLSADGNQARLLQPIPRLYGRHILNPDYAAKPYSYFYKNEQFLCQLFALGVGTYDLEEIRIDKTTIWQNGNFTGSYAAIQIAKYEPGQQVTLFAPEVETSSEVSGQEMVRLYNTFTARFQSNSIVQIDKADGDKIDGPAYLGNYRPGDVLIVTGSNGNDGNYTITDIDKVANSYITVDRVFPVQGDQPSVSTQTEGWVGPFNVNPPRTLINKIEIDLDFPEGSYSLVYNNLGQPVYSFPTQNLELNYRTIDSLGQPTSGWTSVAGPPNFSFAYPTFTDQRETRTINVPNGRYQVRFRRLTVRRYDQVYHNVITWTGLKGYYADITGVYPDVTLLAIKIRADNQISSQTSRKFATIQTAKLPQWQSDGTWSTPVPTRRISDAFNDICRSSIYGAGLSDDRIDFATLASLQTTWDARGDTFDGVFDTKYTIYDALAAVLLVGRAKPLLVGGVLTAVRDEPRALARAVFTPFNIKQGTLEIDHVMNDVNSPTDAIVSFIDERTWTTNEVECYIDEDDRDNPARIDGFGIVNRNHAWREGIYQVASNKYRRIFATMSTEMEGKLLMPLDKVVINHDLPKFGQAGVIWDISSDGLAWYSTEPFVMPTVGTAYVGIRMKNGRLWGPVKVKALVDTFDDTTVYLIDSDGSMIIDSDTSFIVESNGNSIESYMVNEKAIIILDNDDYALVQASQGPVLDVINVNYNNNGDPGLIVFGTADNYVKPFRVVSVSPKSDIDVSVVLTNDDARVYTAETDYTIPNDS